MASQRFLLLVNNIVIRDEQNNPIVEVQEGSRRYYSNDKGNNDLEDRVKEVIDNISAAERDNELYELVTQTQVLTRHNREFKLKMYITPLYELQLQLANNPNATRIAGSTVDVQNIWQKQLYDFYATEFLKYSQIMDYLESLVRIIRPKDSPFRIRNGDTRVMSIVHIKVDGLFNPLDTIKGLDDTKLFKYVYGKQEQETSFSIDDPAIFPVPIMRGSVTCYFATASDVLKLCNISHKEAISSRNLYRLIAAIVLKNMFRASLDNGLTQAVLSFPINKVLYEMVDPTTGTVDRYFEDPASASAYAAEENYTMRTLDTDANYIVSTFPSFKGRGVTAETQLLHEIRGAQFV